MTRTAVLMLVVVAVVATASQTKKTIPERVCHTKEYVPVCVSNGVTYSNLCTLDIAYCNDNDITIRSLGKCEKKQCAKWCSNTADPVCGTDGVTYESDCMLDNARCNDATLHLAYRGECGEILCPDVYCDPNEYKPVCGTNGVSLTSLHVYSATCHDPTIFISTQGECKRECLRPCTKEYVPVCGSNGVTYSNLCTLDIAYCNDNDITIRSLGKCENSQEEECPTLCPLHYDPRCDNNGKVYGNECQLNIAICNDPSLKPGACQIWTIRNKLAN
ncbi:four-domain proteases inhibitor-like [Homarus americanus]|uniref:four-domain proteases inhibitor-like n=1 Tax=Homarus americanus TaxID=6706 RepID=UPI001C495FE1|nr:four-domain proteases inhibitor-like [Homarus americanus]